MSALSPTDDGNTILCTTSGNKYLISRTDVNNPLGKGAFGCVYKGKRVTDNIEFAIKQISKSCSVPIEKIKNEIDILSKIKTIPNVGNLVYSEDIAEDDKFYFIVMNYFNEGTLTHFIQKCFIKSEQEAIEYLRQICYGLRFLHNIKIIHRDIKTDNILMASYYDKYYPYSHLLALADYGLSACKTNEMTKMVGTPDTQAPEVSTGIYDERADIYSIGCIYYYMLTGTALFRGTNINTIANDKKDWKSKIKAIDGRYSKFSINLLYKCLEYEKETRISNNDLFSLLELDTLYSNFKQLNIVDNIAVDPYLNFKIKTNNIEDKLTNKLQIDYAKALIHSKPAYTAEQIIPPPSHINKYDTYEFEPISVLRQVPRSPLKNFIKYTHGVAIIVLAIILSHLYSSRVMQEIIDKYESNRDEPPKQVQLDNLNKIVEDSIISFEQLFKHLNEFVNSALENSELNQTNETSGNTLSIFNESNQEMNSSISINESGNSQPDNTNKEILSTKSETSPPLQIINETNSSIAMQSNETSSLNQSIDLISPQNLSESQSLCQDNHQLNSNPESSNISQSANTSSKDLSSIDSNRNNTDLCTFSIANLANDSIILRLIGCNKKETESHVNILCSELKEATINANSEVETYSHYWSIYAIAYFSKFKESLFSFISQLGKMTILGN